MMRRVIGEKVRIRDGDRIRTMSALEAMFQRLKIDALKGDVKAIVATIKLIEDFDLFKPPPPPRPSIQVSFAGPGGKPVSMTDEEFALFDKWKRETGRATDGAV
jgi:hypothetical protein